MYCNVKYCNCNCSQLQKGCGRHFASRPFTSLPSHMMWKVGKDKLQFRTKSLKYDITYVTSYLCDIVYFWHHVAYMTSSMSQSIPIASRHVARRSFASPTSDVWKVTNAIWWMRHWCNLRKKWCQFKTGSKFNSRLTPNDKNAVNVVLLKKDEKTFDKCQVSIEKKTKNVANV